MTELVYRATGPKAAELVTDLDARGKAITKARRKFLADFTTKHGLAGLEKRRLGVRGDKAYGVERGAEEKPPAGWRVSGDEYLIPDKRCKAGKAAAVELAALDYPDVHAALENRLGMLTLAFGPNALHRPGYAADRENGAVYVMWSVRAVADEVDEYLAREAPEGVTWEKVPLSAYYAWRESCEAANAEVKS